MEPETVETMTPLYDTQTEKVVLAQILRFGEEPFQQAMAAELEPEHYYDQRNRIVHRAFFKLVGAGTPIDTLSVKRYLEDTKQIDQVGISHLCALEDPAEAPINLDVGFYASRIVELANTRKIVSAAATLQAAASSGNGDLKHAIADIRKVLEAQAANQKTLMPTIHWAGAALEPQPEKEWVVQDIVGFRDVAILVSDAGGKKTWTSLDLAVCVAMGKPWIGRRVIKSRVLIVDEESGERRLKIRVGDCMRGHGAGPDLPIAFTSLAGITLSNDAGAATLSRIITETDARFIILDALQDLTLGLDENSGQELAPVIYRLKTIAEKHDCAIWVLHHLNKAGGYRGHSSIKGLVDVMIRCESDPSSSLIEFTPEKTRDALITSFAATAHFEIGKFWLSEAQATEGRFTASESFVIDYLNKVGSATIADIMASASVCSPETARRTVYRLAERHIIERSDAGGSGRQATYKPVQNRCAQVDCTPTQKRMAL